MPRYGNSAPGSQKWNFSKSKFFHFRGKVSQISLLTSPLPPPDIKFKSSYARKRDFGLYAQIWKFGPRLPKMEFFKKFSFFGKVLQISLLTTPQPPADIKFKSSHARKHIIKKVESRIQLLNPDWRSYQSFN